MSFILYLYLANYAGDVDDTPVLSIPGFASTLDCEAAGNTLMPQAWHTEHTNPMYYLCQARGGTA